MVLLRLTHIKSDTVMGSYANKILVLFLLIAGCAAPGHLKTSSRPGEETELKSEALIHFVTAKAFELRENYYAAIVEFMEAARLDSTSASIYYAIARNYMALREFDHRALEFTQKAIRIDPSFQKANNLLINLYRKKGDSIGMERGIKKLIELDPRDYNRYFDLINLYFRENRSEEAIEILDKLETIEVLPTKIRFAIARNYSVLGKMPKAKKNYRRVIADDPNFADAWLRLGLILESEGDKERAMELYEEVLSQEALKGNPRDINIFDRLSSIYLSDDDLIDRAIEKTGENRDFLYYLGSTFLTKGKFKEAEVVFKALADEGKDDKAYNLLGASLSARKKYDEAVWAYKMALEVQPNNSDYLRSLGLALSRSKRHDEAVELFRSRLEEEPDKKLYLFGLGQALSLADSHNEAIETLRSLVEMEPDNVEYEYGLGDALYRSSSYTEAVAVFRALLERDPNNTEFALSLAYTLSRAKLHKEAIKLFRDLHMGDPENESYLFGLARALNRSGAYDDAIQIYASLVEKDPQNTIYLFGLGNALERTGSSDEAVSTFETLLRIDPDHAFALNYLGYIFIEKGIKLHESVGMIKKALVQEPQNGPFWDSLGWAYYQLGQLDKAEEYLDKAVTFVNENDKENAVIFDHLGDISFALEKFQKAQTHWIKSLQIDPENDKVREKLGRLSK